MMLRLGAYTTVSVSVHQVCCKKEKKTKNKKKPQALNKEAKGLSSKHLYNASEQRKTSNTYFNTQTTNTSVQLDCMNTAGIKHTYVSSERLRPQFAQSPLFSNFFDLLRMQLTSRPPSVSLL